jgi:hypothetical protein
MLASVLLLGPVPPPSPVTCISNSRVACSSQFLFLSEANMLLCAILGVTNTRMTSLTDFNEAGNLCVIREICLEKLRKAMKTEKNEESPCSGRDSNHDPLQYVSEMYCRVISLSAYNEVSWPNSSSSNQGTKLGGPPRPPRRDTNAPYEKVFTPLDILTFYIWDRFCTPLVTWNFADFTISIFIFNLITCIRTTS